MTPSTDSRRWPLWISIVVLAGTALIHIFMGTPEILGVLQKTDLSSVVISTFGAAWHLVSVTAVALPVALVWSLRAERVAALPVVTGVWLLNVAFAVVFLVIVVADYGTAIFTLPQWVLFAVPSLLLPWWIWNKR